jgi:hypothetical protein
LLSPTCSYRCLFCPTAGPPAAPPPRIMKKGRIARARGWRAPHGVTAEAPDLLPGRPRRRTCCRRRRRRRRSGSSPKAPIGHPGGSSNNEEECGLLLLLLLLLPTNVWGESPRVEGPPFALGLGLLTSNGQTERMCVGCGPVYLPFYSARDSETVSVEILSLHFISQYIGHFR